MTTFSYTSHALSLKPNFVKNVYVDIYSMPLKFIKSAQFLTEAKLQFNLILVMKL